MWPCLSCVCVAAIADWSTLARATPSSLAGSLKMFDEVVRSRGASHLAFPSTQQTQPGQLSLGFGGLRLRSLSHHSCAAFIASLSTSGCSSAGTTGNHSVQ